MRMRSSLLAAPLSLATLRSLWKPRRDSYANARLYEDNRIGMPEAASTHRQRCIELMTKELLLAQSSDWPFLMKNEPSREYAERRTREHLERFDRVWSVSAKAEAGSDLLAEIEEADPVFSDLPWNLYEPYA